MGTIFQDKENQVTG